MAPDEPRIAYEGALGFRVQGVGLNVKVWNYGFRVQEGMVLGFASKRDRNVWYGFLGMTVAYPCSRFPKLYSHCESIV